jgi:3-oxoacyl-[acyl-carrier-protein] synthase-3
LPFSILQYFNLITQNIIITGTGSYIPENKISQVNFENSLYYDTEGKQISDKPSQIAQKLEEITGITERRYATKDQTVSDLALIAAERAIKDAGIDKESIDAIILAHNFGYIPLGSAQMDAIPSIASRVKHELKILNPNCVAFDIVFGCPGWVQALIIARQYILIEDAKRVLVIGAETLSRVLDPFDRDSMIYGDGAAATIVEGTPNLEKRGIISTAAQTFTLDEAYYLYSGTSNKKDEDETRYLKMHGKKIYEFALRNVPKAMKLCLEKSGIPIEQLKKIFIHQANEKMDMAILKNFYKLYGAPIPEGIMPMNIHKLGNSSVATIPTLLDMVLKGQLPGHTLQKGDVILLASVGAGMNINAVTYVM